MPAAGGCNPAAKEPPPRQMAARQTRRTAASRRPTAIGSRNKERNEYTQYGNETLGQGLRARQDDRGIYRRQRPRTGHAACALRRPGLAGAYRHARNDRAADGRRTGKADGGTERDRRRDRGRALRNRTRAMPARKSTRAARATTRCWSTSNCSCATNCARPPKP